MSDVDVRAKLRVEDEASGALGKIAKSAGNLTDKLLHFGGELVKIAGLAGGVGAAFSFFGAIESSEKYLKNLKEVGELTGMAAEETDFLFSSARKAGVEFDQMQQIMFRLSRRGAAMESMVAGANDQGKALSQKFRKMGVDITKGPMEQLGQMSELVKKGQLDAGDLMARFQIPQGAANDFKQFLEGMADRKPGETMTEFAKRLEELKKKGQLVTAQDMETFNRIEGLRHNIADGFNRIKIAIGKEVLPIIADMLARFEKALPDWIEKAQTFGKFLREHMDAAIAGAKLLGKIMLANSAINMFSGGKMGLVGAVKAAPAFANTLVQGIAKIFPKLGQLGAGVGMKVMGAAAGPGGMAAAGPMATALGTLAGSFTVLLPIILAVAAVVGIAYLAFKGFQKNVDGAKDSLLAIWDRFKAKLDMIKDAFQPIITGISKLFGGDGTITTFLEKIATGAVLGLFTVIDKALEGWVLLGYVIAESKDMALDFWHGLTRGLQLNFVDPVMATFKAIKTLIDRLFEGDFAGAFEAAKKAFTSASTIHAPLAIAAESAADALGSGMERAMAKMNREMQTRAAINKAMREKEAQQKTVEEKRPPKTEMHFPNARFDITQNFAEGFDPDRIAVAFGNDLASLGEFRTQSGFAPAFAVR